MTKSAQPNIAPTETGDPSTRSPPSPPADFAELRLAAAGTDEPSEDVVGVMGRMTKYDALMSLLTPHSSVTDGTHAHPFGRLEVTKRSDSALMQQLRVRVPFDTTNSNEQDASTETTESSGTPKGETVARNSSANPSANSSAAWIIRSRTT
ncbi:hypothetical protein T484DRAFT_1749635 [Baffinella frigidus]|nr:hypothetical protein T484DRAFT_1749635 [Cryptophyta sp. CCMP2293]